MIDHALIEHLNLIASDPALLNQLRHQHPGFVDLCRVIVPPPPPTIPKIGFPAIPTMTAVQVALFDNWPQGRRVDGKPCRYAMTFEIWTCEADRINVNKRNHQQKASAALMDRKALLTWLKARLKDNDRKQEEYRLSDGFLADLVDVADGMKDNDYVGLFAHKTPGTRFFDSQLIHVRLDGSNTVASLIVDGEVLALPTFSPFKPNSTERHGGLVWLQSRADLCGFSTAWATGDA